MKMTAQEVWNSFFDDSLEQFQTEQNYVRNVSMLLYVLQKEFTKLKAFVTLNNSDKSEETEEDATIWPTAELERDHSTSGEETIVIDKNYFTPPKRLSVVSVNETKEIIDDSFEDVSVFKSPKLNKNKKMLKHKRKVCKSLLSTSYSTDSHNASKHNSKVSQTNYSSKKIKFNDTSTSSRKPLSDRNVLSTSYSINSHNASKHNSKISETNYSRKKIKINDTSTLSRKPLSDSYVDRNERLINDSKLDSTNSNSGSSTSSSNSNSVPQQEHKLTHCEKSNPTNVLLETILIKEEFVNSFDWVPVKEVKKEQKNPIKCYEDREIFCEDCRKVFAPNSKTFKCVHRRKKIISNTPPGYWNPEFSPTQQVIDPDI